MSNNTLLQLENRLKLYPTSYIRGVRHTIVEIPLQVDFAITGSSQSSCSIVLIEVSDSNGLKGYGECCPLPTVTRDSVDSTISFLEDHKKTFEGCAVLSALKHVCHDLRYSFGAKATSALTGLEMAFLDLLSKSVSQPLWVFISESQNQRKLTDLEIFELDLTVPALDPDQLHKFWATFEHLRCRKFKVKVTGSHPECDIARVKMVWDKISETRATFEPNEESSDFCLVVDGNQGFSAEAALSFSEKIAQENIPVGFFEQPHDQARFEDFRVLAERCVFPICLDESIKSFEDLREHSQTNQRFWVNLKTMKSGVLEALRIGSLARAMGLPLMIGGMMETDLSMTCSMHIARALGGVEWVDLDTPFFLTEQLCVNSPYEKGSLVRKREQGLFVRMPNRPGIGIDPKQQRLKQLDI